MRKILLIIGLLAGVLAARVVTAQTGAIQYEDRVNMHRRLPPDRQDMKAMIPEFRTTKFLLSFNTQESLYKTIVEDEEDQEFSHGGGQGGGMRMTFRGQNTELYVNQSTSQMLSRQEFMGKEYLIVDTLEVSPWKFGTETKTILGFECRQAYYTDSAQVNINGTTRTEKREITAWYTDKVRPFLGPDRYNTLPGAVLAIDINSGERVLVATKVDLRELKKNELKAPEKGQRTSQAEYRKTIDEQMKRMGGGGMIIRN